MWRITSLVLLSIISCHGFKEYILNTQKCKLPKIDPFDEEVQNITQPQPYEPCTKNELLTFVTKVDDVHVLHLREDLLSEYSSNNVTCCYSYVTRHGSREEPDVGIHISKCKPLIKSKILRKNTVMVTCEDDNKTLVYENVHQVVAMKRSVQARIYNYNETKPWSVLFVVIDSVSRLNFIRSMRQTYRFLKDNNFVEMKGYTKVADNTFPNFITLITGLTPAEANKKCKPHTVNGLIFCPMIWYDYRNLGYITAYAEDNTPIATFNYLKKGFRVPPTDYYFKPYLEATETLDVRELNYMPYCTGPESAGERVLNLAKDFATTFKNYSNFGVFWMNTFSHDEFNAPYVMDERVKDFFADLKAEGVLDESIVVLLSDHGIRFGDIRTTRSGWFEERMPVNMISVPGEFREKFPDLYRNLEENSNKLTSNFDMFFTLQHILNLSGLDYRGKRSLACPKCRSVFQEIPDSRSCEDAGIPPQWCTCHGHFHPIDESDGLAMNATDLAIQKFNSQTYDLCPKISLDLIISASLSEPLEDQTQYLFTVFETYPPNVVLVTVKFKKTISEDSTFYIRTIGNECITK